MTASIKNKLVFWDPTGYTFDIHDYLLPRFVSDGMGGQIGVKFALQPGATVVSWGVPGSVVPHGSIGDTFGTTSFGKNQQADLTTSSVNAIRMQAPPSAIAHATFIIELDFSRYKGSGTDGVAGDNTFIGVSDIYSGLTQARTTVTFTCTRADGSPGSTAGWTLLNGGPVPAIDSNYPSAQLSFSGGVLRGTSTPAPGGQPNSLDTVLGPLRLDASGCRTVRLTYDIYPLAPNMPLCDNSGLYVATALRLGKIVVNNDEWTLSNLGLSKAPAAATFATNIAKWFTGGRAGKFLAYSANHGLIEDGVAKVMTGAGHGWTVSRNVPFTLATLQQYDGVFLAGDPADNAVLTQYVAAGGNVYLAGGTGQGGAAAEAAQWNGFLNAFGLAFAPSYNGIEGTFPPSAAHPIAVGVTSIYCQNGNSVSRLNASDPHTKILSISGTNGIIAVYE